MAELADAIFHRLDNFSGLSSLVTSRIYRGMAPANPTKPFVVYQHISGSRFQSIGGPVGMAQPRIQIDCYDDTLDGAHAVATQIRFALDGYEGTNASVEITGSTLLTDFDLIEEGITPALRRVTMDFLISHRENTS
jgi:hypothetical protein